MEQRAIFRTTQENLTPSDGTLGKACPDPLDGVSECHEGCWLFQPDDEPDAVYYCCGPNGMHEGSRDQWLELVG